MSAEQTKSRILEAGFREFAEYGVAGARVDRIAKSAACNKNLIYVYFGSKEALFASVLDRHLSEAYVGMTVTPEDLPGYARRVFDLAQANPGVYRLLAWATLERAAALPPVREREHDSTLPLILMAVMALATAWSPVFPFGATANPTADLSPDTIRDTIAGMVARIVGRNAPGADAANAATPSGQTRSALPQSSIRRFRRVDGDRRESSDGGLSACSRGCLLWRHERGLGRSLGRARRCHARRRARAGRALPVRRQARPLRGQPGDRPPGAGRSDRPADHASRMGAGQTGLRRRSRRTPPPRTTGL